MRFPVTFELVGCCWPVGTREIKPAIKPANYITMMKSANIMRTSAIVQRGGALVGYRAAQSAFFGSGSGTAGSGASSLLTRGAV